MEMRIQLIIIAGVNKKLGKWLGKVPRKTDKKILFL